MIPKASQRGLGQDLATHLQNACDNEYVEIAEVRGAVARDLHGAFAEWEVCAHAMTGMGHSFPEYTAQYVAELLKHAPELLGDERADAERMWSPDDRIAS